MKVYILTSNDGSPGDRYQGVFAHAETAKRVAATREGIASLEWWDTGDGDWHAQWWDIVADEIDETLQ